MAHLHSIVSDQLSPRSSLRQAGGPEAIAALHLPRDVEERALRLGLRMVSVDLGGPHQCDSVRISEGGSLLLLDAGGDVIHAFSAQGWHAFDVMPLELN